jgi:hypothetical protein
MHPRCRELPPTGAQWEQIGYARKQTGHAASTTPPRRTPEPNRSSPHLRQILLKNTNTPHPPSPPKCPPFGAFLDRASIHKHLSIININDIPRTPICHPQKRTNPHQTHLFASHLTHFSSILGAKCPQTGKPSNQLLTIQARNQPRSIDALLRAAETGREHTG